MGNPADIVYFYFDGVPVYAENISHDEFDSFWEAREAVYLGLTDG